MKGEKKKKIEAEKCLGRMQKPDTYIDTASRELGKGIFASHVTPL